MDSLRSNMKRTARSIRGADTVLIASHVHPDGDTIGCLLALGLGLLHAGKRVVMLSPDGVPPRFQFLPGADLVLSEYKGKADVAIAVDCGSLKQLGPSAALFRAARTTIQIDHHDFGEPFCKIMIVDTEAAAVGEIIYDFLKLLRVKISAAIATCLLTSVIVDTGSFRFSNVRGRTLRISADLLEKGADMKYLIEEAYWKRSLPTARLEATSVFNMKFEMNGAVVWTLVRQKDFDKENGLMGDADGVTDALRSIEGVKVAALMRETGKGTYRVSLRSGMGINVARVAQMFGGGGHHNAAGCSIRATQKVRRELIRELCRIAA